MNRRTFLSRLVAFVGLLPFVRLKPDPRVAAAAPASGLFNPSADVARQYREGLMFRADAFELAMAPFDQQPVAMCTCADWLTCEHPWPVLVRRAPLPGRTGKTISTGNWCGTQL